MTHRYVALLRGINLGKRRVPMPRLKALFEELAFTGVATFIASGNVVFSSRESDPARLEARIARHLEAGLGFAVDTFVRPAGEIVAIGRLRVFPEEGRPGITVHVGFFHQALPAGTARKLGAIRTATDEIRVRGREYYWLCRIRTSDSKVWMSPEVRGLRLPTSTMRNLTSLRKLIAQHLE